MSNRTIQINIRVSPEEYKRICKSAKVCDRVVSAYIRDMALNMCVYQYDYTVVENHTKELSIIRNALVHLIYTIKKVGNYVPADLEYILLKMNEIFRSEKIFLQNDLNAQERIAKELGEAVRAIVDQHLSKIEK